MPLRRVDAERGELWRFYICALRLLEKLDVLGIGTRPAAFNVMNPESVELVGNAEFVCDREIDAFALTAIAQGRIVDFDFGFHCFRKSGNKYLSEIGLGGKSQNPALPRQSGARKHPILELTAQ